MIGGFDIGGTYTDIVILDPAGKELRIGKVSSTPADHSEAFLAGLESLAVDPADLQLIIHGTTVATNAILERNGGKCGLIATKGFRDILELRRRDRPHLYGLTGDYRPLIPRYHRLEVTERVSAEGEVLTPLDEEELIASAEHLVGEGVEAIVVSLLNSYANAVHERQAKQLLEQRWPELFVVASSDVLPLFREFERTSTAVVNAYVQPVVSRYLTRLRFCLREGGYDRDLLVMQSNGGTVGAAFTSERPVNTVLSGPAAGVIAAAEIAAESGFRNLINYDMGGTSLDVSLVVEGKPVFSSGREIEFGVPVMLSMIDIQTVGAGGGSVARIDEGGILQVGPKSAGSEPGPICYGRGGAYPTVTDAHVVLGRINPHYRIAGGSLDVESAGQGIANAVGKPLGLSTEAAAEAVLAVAANRTIGSIRRISIDRGHDPRDFALFSFGGAGPLLISHLLRETGAHVGVVPYYPGVLSAWGCAIANLQRDYVTMVNRRLTDLSIDEVIATLNAQHTEGEQFLSHETVSVSRIHIQREAELSFEGQTHLLRISLPTGDLSLSAIRATFLDAYLKRFGASGEQFYGLDTLLDELPVRLMNLRTTVIGVRSDYAMKDLIPKPQNSLAEAVKGKRPVWAGGEWIECPTYERAALPYGAELNGPAVIEQHDTTTWIEISSQAQVDDAGNLIVRLN